jgi:hypothetical protein
MVPDTADRLTTTYVYPAAGSFDVGARVVDDEGLSALATTTVDVVIQALDPIDDLRARPKSGKVSLAWTPMPDAVAYNIYRRTDTEALALITGNVVTNLAPTSTTS